ncbi:MAG: MarR family transcriptional regulator, partial [Desulfobacterales bacterium]|nr:MarR family transcriptional regulator [Desulfobacterales bacterium]
MAEDTLLKQAQYLFTTSRLIRSHISKINADRVKNSPVGTAYQNLTMAQHAAIMIIDARGPSTIKALAEALGISAPSASAMVDKLVSTGV